MAAVPLSSCWGWWGSGLRKEASGALCASPSWCLLRASEGQPLLPSPPICLPPAWTGSHRETKAGHEPGWKALVC